VVLGLVGVKLLIEDLVKIGPVASLAGIAVAFTIGIGLSVRADRHDPDAEHKREERAEALHEASLGLVDGAPAEEAGESEQSGAGHDVDGREQARAEALPDERNHH
jgi:hypothetical protein